MSSNVNEVIRAVLNSLLLFFFYKKISREEKKIEKREKSSQYKCTKYRGPHSSVHVRTPILT